MKVAFFHTGEMYLALNALARKMGWEIVNVPKTNKSIIEKGLKYADEFSCFPFKVFLGHYLTAVENGAELLFMQKTESITSCQYADFPSSIKNILAKKGFKFDIIVLDKFSPLVLQEKLKKYKDVSVTEVSEVMLVFSLKISLFDKIDEYFRRLSILSQKEAVLFKEKWNSLVDKTDSIFDLYVLKYQVDDAFKKYAVPKPIYKVAVIGDIYTINDSYLNNDIFRKLALLNVYAAKGHVVSDFFNKENNSRAQKYLKHHIGGIAKDTLSRAVKYAEQGYDGLIHIYPFNCMPETVVRSILPKLGKDYNIPILYLPIDEQTGTAGFDTRIDAFIDLIKMRKES